MWVAWGPGPGGPGLNPLVRVKRVLDAYNVRIFPHLLS